MLVLLASFSGLACNSSDGGGGNASTDADLVDLLVSAGVLVPAFDPGTTSYTVMTTAATSSTAVTPTSSDANATLEVNGQAATSGMDFGPVPLSEGPNPIDVIVTAADGATTRTYTVVVTRPPFTRPTELAASPSAALHVRGNWLVYLASEAFNGPVGTDLNGDGDTLDEVAVAVAMSTNVEEMLGVATETVAILGEELYLVVDESEDGRDWNADLASGTVLLHWSAVAGSVTLVDALKTNSGGPDLLVAGNRIYYATDVSLGLTDETSIRLLDPGAPTTPAVVLNEAGAGAVVAGLMAQDQGLLFLTLDEARNGQDLNADGDSMDENVLALLDGTDPAARVKNVELALRDESSPVDARQSGANDWLVAFLVDEAAQGNASLNDPNDFIKPLLPATCAANPADTDAVDEVLHYLEFAGFLAGTAVPVATGIAGDARVLALTGVVATISPEVDAGCDLNDDGDTDDEVARWVAAVVPNTPEVDPTLLQALATSTAGGSMGLAQLDDRLVAVIDEAADSDDFDTQAGEASADHDLVAWIEPTLGTPTWHFSHQSSNRSIGTGVFDSTDKSEPFAGTTWMAAEAVGDRLPLVFLEEVPGATNPNLGSLNTNVDCFLVQKDNDELDGLPVWADFEPGPTLDFDGLGYAVDKANAGIEIAAGLVFFRVSEADDNRDYNEDGDTSDAVVFFNSLTSCGPHFLATSSSLPGSAIETDGTLGAALLSSEAMAGVDLNADGDTSDLVVRYFQF